MFPSRFSKIIFEKGMIRQFQWLALVATGRSVDCREAACLGAEKSRSQKPACNRADSHPSAVCTIVGCETSYFVKETVAQQEYTANGRHISRTKQWRWVFVPSRACTLVIDQYDPS